MGPLIWLVKGTRGTNGHCGATKTASPTPKPQRPGNYAPHKRTQVSGLADENRRPVS